MLFRRCPCRCAQKTTYKETFSEANSEVSWPQNKCQWSTALFKYISQISTFWLSELQVARTGAAGGKGPLISDPDTKVQVNGGRAKKYMRVSDLETDQSFLWGLPASCFRKSPKLHNWSPCAHTRTTVLHVLYFFCEMGITELRRHFSEGSRTNPSQRHSSGNCKTVCGFGGLWCSG